MRERKGEREDERGGGSEREKGRERRETYNDDQWE